MDIAAALDFVREHHRAVLCTTRADGGAQLSPVLAAVDGNQRVVVSTRAGAAKTANLRHRPHASLLALSDGFFGSWVQVGGPVQVVTLPEAMEGLVDYYRRTAGEHPDWEEYRSAMRSEGRVLLRMTVEHAGPDRAG
jgi:PPOX class probable F420-dependent enzyme